MMDVLHFLFEEDFTATSEAHAHSRSAVRDTFYTQEYGVPYHFKLKTPGSRGTPAGMASNAYDYSEFEASLAKEEAVNPNKNEPFSPRNNPKISFVDASEIAPVEQSFEGIDGPLN